MQTVIRPITVAIALVSLAGPAFAGPPGKGSATGTSQTTAASASATAGKPAASETATTLVATGTIIQFDATGQALTLSTSKGEQHFTVSPEARLRDSSHAISPADLGTLTGHKATVRYRESGGARNVESIHVSSSAPKTSAKK